MGVHFWENEDGDYWVEVASAADEETAGKGIVEETGCAYVTDGKRTSISTQDCECMPAHTADPDSVKATHPSTGVCGDHSGTACVTHDDVECWEFFGGWDISQKYQGDIEEIQLELKDGRHAYLPTGWSVNDDLELVYIPVDHDTIPMDLA